MKKYLIILLVLIPFIFAAAIQDKHKGVIARKNAGGAAPTYLLQESFDSAGYDDGDWSESGDGTINEDYTTSILEGTQSLYVYDSSGDSYAQNDTGTGLGEVWVYFILKNETDAADDDEVFRFRNAAETTRCDFKVSTGDVLYIVSGGQQAGPSSEPTISSGETMHIWGYFKYGSGANSICRMWHSANGTKPGTPTLEVTNGNITSADVRKFSFQGSDGRGWVFDKVRIDDEEIGSNPQ